MDAYISTFIDILKSRPDLALTVGLLFWGWTERSERIKMTNKNFDLTDKMHEQNKDSNELLGQIKFLLEQLTKGRK